MTSNSNIKIPFTFVAQIFLETFNEAFATQAKDEKETTTETIALHSLTI